ncbi:MAG TPA: transglutaminaseTgpA domain-containing protein, partial [Rubrobacter sp.]|nr:transglutaminaseTgpA domain-containing protein [Rubrobacter sp.]
MSGLGTRLWLYGAALATGSAFSILFTGETYDGADGGFGALSVVTVIAGHKALLPFLLAAAVAALVGSAGRWRFVLLLPAIAAYTLVAVYGTDLFSVSGWQEFFGVIWGDVYGAANTMYVQPIPYDLAPGLFVVLVPLVMILVAFATSATLYEESPVISVAVLGLTIGVLSTISFEDGAGPFFAVFLVCAVGLFLSTGGAGPDGPGRPAVVGGAIVIALVLLVPRMPFSDETVSTGLIDWTRIGTGGTSRLGVQADVGDYLTAGREAELLRIRSSEPLLWRGGTMDYFDGVRWSDTTQVGANDGEEIARDVETRPVLQTVQVLNAQTDLIFGGYKIVQVKSRTSEFLGATPNSDGSWSMDEPFEEGASYYVLSEIPQPTRAQLRGAGSDYPSTVEKKFLQLPEDTPPVVGETAKKIQRRYEPATPYDRARAIEQYLIYDGGFTYNLDVSYRRADQAVEEFLGDGKEGFCTQFSTSMALLLRDMNVPSRVVYGATSGEEVSQDEYLVTGSNMHTWVEAYFPGVGWYPFNPTPGFSMPAAMQANAPRPALPAASELQSPENNLDRRPRAQDRAQQNPAEQNQDLANQGPTTNRSEENGVPVWPLFVLAPLLLVASVPLSKRALLVRGRPEDLYRDLTGRLRDVLPPGKSMVADSPALTPTERVLLLAGAAGVEETPMRRFALAYSDHLYSGRG